MSLQPGVRLGPYEITTRLGLGGMGEVFRARDTSLNREVAIKVLPDGLGGDAQRLSRFQHEAEALAALNHPNIAQIYGLERSGPTPAIVMELVEGQTLRDRIRSGPVPIDETLSITRQIADGLAAAHARGIIHRDLKPANVKVRSDGTVKILDFGLAKALHPEIAPGATDAPTISVGTTAGMLVGTPSYMSPEQAASKPVDRRTDIWALGVLMYEMLTGRRLFAGETAAETLAAVLGGEIDFTRLPRETPARLRRVVQACLARDPDQRIHDVADVRLALQGAFDTSADARTAGAPSLRIWQRPLPALAIALGVAVIGALAAWLSTRPTAAPVVRSVVPFAADQALSGADRPSVAISPDGRRIVYAANGRLWLRRIDQLQGSAIPGTEGASVPFFAPDGRFLGFWASDHLWKVALSGGAPISIAEVPNEPVDGASWGDEDVILYGAGSIMRTTGAGAAPEVAVPLDEPEAAHGPQMLPGGEWILYTLRTGGNGSWNAAQIVVQSTTTGERKVLLTGRDARYLPTGHLVYALNNTIFAAPFDVGRRTVTGGSVSLVEGVDQAGPTGGAAQFSVSATGTLLYAPISEGGGTGVSLTWVTREGFPEPTKAPRRTYANVRLSPHGERVAADVGDGRQRDIWVLRLDDGTLTPVARHQAQDRFPLWTRDGAAVVFESGRDGGGLFRQAADGTGPVERLTDFAAVPCGWTPDGRLLFLRGSGTLGLLTIDGSRRIETLLDADFHIWNPALSADGRWLAYESDESDEREIWVRPFPAVDHRWQVSTDTGANPAWSPDGRHLFYVTGSNVLMVADVAPDREFHSSPPVEAFGGPDYLLGGAGRNYDISRNERFLVRTRRDATAGAPAFNGLVVVQHWFDELTSQVPGPSQGSGGG